YLTSRETGQAGLAPARAKELARGSQAPSPALNKLSHLGGIVVRHARSLILNLPEDYPYFKLYESLACQIRGPCPV
ncbi:MAG: hypothetical protein ACE5JA_08440, partial [bacterium]